MLVGDFIDYNQKYRSLWQKKNILIPQNDKFENIGYCDKI